MRSFAKKTKKEATEKSKAEKDAIKDEFADMDTDDLRAQFVNELEEVLLNLEEKLSKIKSGRASPDAFDDIQVKAYGEMMDFGDLC